MQREAKRCLGLKDTGARTITFVYNVIITVVIGDSPYMTSSGSIADYHNSLNALRIQVYHSRAGSVSSNSLQMKERYVRFCKEHCRPGGFAKPNEAWQSTQVQQLLLNHHKVTAEA